MSTNSQDNLKIVQDFFAALAKGERDKTASILDDKVKWLIPGRHPLSGTRHGPDEVIAFFEEAGKTGFKSESIYLGADEQYVVDVHRGWTELAGKPNVDTLWTSIYRIENGKIVEATNMSADQDAANFFFWSAFRLKPLPDRLDTE